MAKGVSGIGVTAATVGGIFLWSGIKGASVTDTIRELITGQQPTGNKVNPIDAKVTTQAPTTNFTTALGEGKYASQILQVCPEHKGDPYCFGGGHSRAPCASRCKDCSGTVSCVLNQVGILSGSLATGGFAKYGSGVSYGQRSPGDLIVWNGGPGGGHIGIIVTASGNGGTMWNNQCSGCGGFKISKYPYGSRSAASAIVRRP
jgi:cell wall-associated NlpC family hydrolase